MTTCVEYVTDALLAASVIGDDQQLPDSMAQKALRRLTRLIGSWGNDVLLGCFATNAETFTMVPNQAAYSTALLAGGRPVSVDSIWVELSNISYPVTMRSQQWYDAVTYKPTSAVPDNCFYDATMPSGTFYFYPTPYAAFTCHVNRRDLLSAATPLLLTTDLILPPGYDKAIVDSLAVDIFPTFKGTQRPIPQDLKDLAREAKRLLRVTNYDPMEMASPFDGNGQNFSNSFLYKGF